MTAVPRRLTGRLRALSASLALLLSTGCPGGDRPRVDAPEVEIVLPPPLVGGPRPSRPAVEPLDGAHWQLPGARDGDLPWLRLVYSQDLRAEIEACGCPGAPTGGLPRRADFVVRLRAVLPGLTVIDGPTALGKSLTGRETVRPEDQARARLVLGLLARGGSTGFFPGHADFAALPPRVLAQEAGALGLPVIATNLGAQVRSATIRDALVVDVSGRRVVFLSLLGAPRSQREREAVPVDDAVAATAAALQRHGPADLVVAFTAADARERSAWREAGLGVDLLLVPFVQEGEPTQRWWGNQLEVVAEPLGRALRRVDIAFSGRRVGLARDPNAELQVASVASDEESWLRQSRTLDSLLARIQAGEDPRVKLRGYDGVDRVDPATDLEQVRASLASVVRERDRSLARLGPASTAAAVVSAGALLLAPELPEDPIARREIDGFHAAFMVDLAAAASVGPPPPDDGRFLGFDACVSCHPGPTGHWPLTAHARAYRTLVERGAQKNPDCLACHATGFGVPGGLMDPDADRHLVNVQCEACHGPMGRHVIDAKRTGLRPAGGGPVTEARCRTCHDPVNSPNFSFDDYVTRIAHPGRGGAPAP